MPAGWRWGWADGPCGDRRSPAWTRRGSLGGRHRNRPRQRCRRNSPGWRATHGGSTEAAKICQTSPHDRSWRSPREGERLAQRPAGAERTPPGHADRLRRGEAAWLPSRGDRESAGTPEGRRGPPRAQEDVRPRPLQSGLAVRVTRRGRSGAAGRAVAEHGAAQHGFATAGEDRSLGMTAGVLA